ncbi:MAG: MFS transporter [Alphaproteobacteria bacterium]|nr:MFS transporter [Alphaproteobacteria bacterium]
MEKQSFLSRNFFVVSFVNLFIFFGFQMIFPVLPQYIQKMGGGPEVIGLVMGIFTVSTLIARPFAGWLLDRVKRKLVLIGGLAVFMAMLFSYALAHTIALVILVRLVHGLGWGFSGTSTATIAAGIIPRERFGEGMGWFSLANSLAMAVAPAAGIYVGMHYRLQSVFYLSSALAFVALCLAFFIRCPNRRNPPASVRFVLYDKDAVRPAVLMFFLSVTYGSVISFLPLYAAGLGIPNIGIFFSIYALAILITRPAAGKLIDRLGLDIIVLPGFLCIFIGIAGLACARELWQFGVVAAVYGLGFGALQTTIQTMAVRDTPFHRLGIANATLFSGFDLGMGLGVIALGSIAALYGYRNMYWFTLLPVIFAMLFYLVFMRRR